MNDIPADHAAEHARIKHVIHMVCIWSWVPCILLFVVFFGAIAGFIPPIKANWDAQQVANFYDDNRDAIRAGLIGALFASALLLPFFTVVSEEMRRIEGRGAMLAPIQWGGAVLLVAVFQLICLMWLVASFRPEGDPSTIQAFNDFGWLVWTIFVPTYSMQFVCMAVAGFMDFRPRPLWPRWAAYANLWVAFLGAGGICAVFFKTGPFSWNGVVGWWIPTIVFALGMTMNMWFMHRHAVAEAARAEESERVRVRSAVAG